MALFAQKRSESTERRREKVTVLVKKGMPLRDIVAELHRVGIKCSPSTVFADLEHLIGEGDIRIEISLAPERVREIEDQFESVSWQPLLDCLAEKTGGLLRDLWVGYSGSVERAQDGFGKWIPQFARNACPFLEKQMRRSACIGTFGGSTAAAMVNALPPVVAGSEPCSVEVVPLAGDPPKLSKHPATSVARGLSTKLTGSYATVPSLEGVPHAPKERTNLENRFPEWGALFYPDGSCRRPLDMVLTSAGCFTKWRVWGSGFGGVNLDAETLQKKAGVVGDIGLTLVPGALQSRDQERRYKDYSGHGTSLSLGALGDLAQRAARDSSIVGVCLVVLGGNKLVVTEALLSRCVNVLVIDSEMALALKRGFKC